MRAEHKSRSFFPIAATAPLTFGVGLGPAAASITVVEVHTEVRASDGNFSVASVLPIDLPGVAGLRVAHTIGPVFTAVPPLPGRARAAAVGGSLIGFLAGATAYVSNLGFGVTVAGGEFIPAGWLDPGYYGQGGQFGDSGPAYFGFRFDAGNGAQLGWAELEMAGAPNNAFSLVRYAYAAPGESLRVGQIPEPNSLALLALGAAGVLTVRRRRM